MSKALDRIEAELDDLKDVKPSPLSRRGRRSPTSPTFTRTANTNPLASPMNPSGIGLSTGGSHTHSAQQRSINRRSGLGLAGGLVGLKLGTAKVPTRKRKIIRQQPPNEPELDDPLWDQVEEKEAETKETIVWSEPDGTKTKFEFDDAGNLIGKKTQAETKAETLRSEKLADELAKEEQKALDTLKKMKLSRRTRQSELQAQYEAQRIAESTRQDRRLEARKVKGGS